MAVFETRRQICLFFTGAFFLTFLIHLFIVAEAKKRFGEHEAEGRPPLVHREEDDNLWSRLKDRLRSRLSSNGTKSTTESQKLFSLSHERSTLHRNDSRKDSQHRIMRRLGKHQKLILDILEAFCDCENPSIPSEWTTKKRPDYVDNSTTQGLPPNDTTLAILKKALTDPVMAQKLLSRYDFCEIDGWIFITAAIILTCFFNYTLVLCCCLCFSAKRRRKVYLNGGPLMKNQKLNYLDSDFVEETDRFLPHGDEKTP